MKTRRTQWIGILVGLAAILLVVSMLSGRIAAASTVKESSNVAALPARGDIVITPLTDGNMPHTADGRPAVSGQQAVEAAKAEFGLSDNRIDGTVGVVRGIATIKGAKAAYNGHKAWIVTADVDINGQGPMGGTPFIYHRLCIVIDAATAHPLFAYAADGERVH